MLTVFAFGWARILDLQSPTPLARRLAPTAYRNSTGDPHDRSDGLVPVASALLAGSLPLVLPWVAHGGAFGKSWYGSAAVVEQWWRALQQARYRPQSPVFNEICERDLGTRPRKGRSALRSLLLREALSAQVGQS